MLLKLKKPDSNTIRHLILYTYVFSLPFDAWDGFKIISWLATSNIFGFIYISISALKYRKLFNINKSQKTLITLIFLWFWLFLTNFIALLIYKYDFNFIYILTFLQSLIMFHLISNEVYYHKETRRNIFLSLLGSILLIYILVSLGYGIQLNRTEIADSLDEVVRVWFFGMNPNSLGNLATFCIIISLGLFFDTKSKIKYLLILLFIPFLDLIVISGSAGAAISLLIGILVFFLLKKGSLHIKIIYYAFAFLLVALALFYVSENEYLSDKLSGFIDTGSTSGRTYIWKYAFQIFQTAPILGLGFTGTEINLNLLTNGHTTAHNVFIDILLWGGIVALLLYLYICYTIFNKSLEYAKLNADPLPLTICLICFLILAKSGGGFFIKYTWVLLASITITKNKSSQKTSIKK